MDEIAEGLLSVVLGVDTHLDVHVGVVVDQLGRVKGTRAVAVTSAGYADLLSWAQGLGTLARASLEGTGTYGAGLARFLSDHGVQVIEVNRPDRSRRRRRGKSDPTDAESAARAVLAGRRRGNAEDEAGPRRGDAGGGRRASQRRQGQDAGGQPAARTSRQS